MPGGLGKALKILNLAQNDLQSGMAGSHSNGENYDGEHNDENLLPVNATELGMYPHLEELDLSRNQVWKRIVFTATY